MNGSTGEDDGFQGRVLNLRWLPGHPLKGMAVDILPISVGGLRAWRKPIDGETLEELEDRRLTVMADHVVSWNLRYRSGTQRGEPLPATLEGLQTFERTAVTEIMQTWLDDGRVPAPSRAEDPENGEDREPTNPLDGTSGGGLPTPESLAAEALIPTQAM